MIKSNFFDKALPRHHFNEEILKKKVFKEIISKTISLTNKSEKWRCVINFHRETNEKNANYKTQKMVDFSWGEKRIETNAFNLEENKNGSLFIEAEFILAGLEDDEKKETERYPNNTWPNRQKGINHELKPSFGVMVHWKNGGWNKEEMWDVFQKNRLLSTSTHTHTSRNLRTRIISILFNNTKHSNIKFQDQFSPIQKQKIVIVLCTETNWLWPPRQGNQNFPSACSQKMSYHSNIWAVKNLYHQRCEQIEKNKFQIVLFCFLDSFRTFWRNSAERSAIRCVLLESSFKLSPLSCNNYIAKNEWIFV